MTEQAPIMTFRLLEGHHLQFDPEVDPGTPGARESRYAARPDASGATYCGDIVKSRVALDKKFNTGGGRKFERLSQDNQLAEAHLPAHCLVWDRTKETSEEFIARMRSLESDPNYKSSSPAVSSQAPTPAASQGPARQPTQPAPTAAKAPAPGGKASTLSTDVEALNGMNLDELVSFAQAEEIEMPKGTNLKDRGSVLKVIVAAYRAAAGGK